MQLRLFLLCILFTLCTSFFWGDDEEKLLRQLHQSAETALQKKEYEKAKEDFEELLSRVSPTSGAKYRMDWPTYVDICLRLASCCDELQNKIEAEKILAMLLAKNPPEELLPKIKLMKARLSATHESHVDTYIEINLVASNLPLESWSSKDLTFFHALETSLNVHFDEMLAKAQRLLLAGFYSDAIHIYEEVLAAIESGKYPKAKSSDNLILKKIRFRLAESYFLAADWTKTLSFCDSKTLTDPIDRELLYLSALCFRERKEFEKALDTFQSYIYTADRDELLHYDHALFEIGCFYYQQGNIAKAKRYFERLQQLDQKPSQLAYLYLARMYLNENEPKKAEEYIAKVLPFLGNKDPVHYEFYYLKGLAAYAVGELSEAKKFFENALCEKRSSWHPDTHYHLGWCCLRLGNDLLKSIQARHNFFNQAEEHFNQIIDTYLHEEASLSLGQLFLLHFCHFGDHNSLVKMDTLLEKRNSFSPEGEIKSLLLCAERATNYDHKEFFYSQATNEKFKLCTSYAQSWYFRGLNHFQQGLNSPQNHTQFFELAAFSFEKAFLCSESEKRHKAANFLKLEAQAHIFLNRHSTSLTLLEKLLNQFEEEIEDREETLYLRGLLATRFSTPSYFSISEDSLLQVANRYPQGKYTDSALYALGHLYYGNKNFMLAKNTFVKLAEEHSESYYAPDAWFWAAECAVTLGENSTSYFRKVYEKYPLNSLAQEAYFRQFTYTLYLEGDGEALAHLKEFENRFPSSPILIIVNYLLGMHEKNVNKAKEIFERGLCMFADYSSQVKAIDPLFVHFRYLIMLSLATSSLCSPTDLEYGECILSSIVSEFLDAEHPLSSLIKQKSLYHPFLEDAEFKLAECFLRQGKDCAAQKMFIQMLAHYKEAGIVEGNYISRVWQEQGKLALRCKDFDTALHCFEIAEECGKRIFDEQKLSLWLLQSECFRGKKEFDHAMRLLSKVINAETASPLRLKAMFLRAEIYELEGRYELAMRQLEATAKKGGEWAHKAEEKLKEKYGL